MPKCIFCGFENEKDFKKKEHIIQEGIGGTLTSSKIVCEKCNETFSQTYDVEINEFYAHIVNLLANWMPSGVKKKKIKSNQNGIPWVLNPGGTLTTDKNIVHSIESGKKVIYASSEEIINNNPTLFNQSEEYKAYPAFPSDYLIPEGILKSKKRITDKLLFAPLINLIEMAEYEAITEGRISSIFSLSRFNSIKKSIINLNPFNIRHELKYFPFSHDLTLLDGLFHEHQNSLFCHRLVIDYDKDDYRLVLSAQHFGSFPWIYIFDNVEIADSSFCLTYYKDLQPSTNYEANKTTLVSESLFNMKDSNYQLFDFKTHNSMEFAIEKLFQNYRETVGKILYEYEQIEDKIYSETLDDIMMVYKIGPKEAIDELFKRRFRTLSLYQIQSVSNIIGLDVKIKYEGRNKACQYLARELKQKFGYPEYVTKLSKEEFE